MIRIEYTKVAEKAIVHLSNVFMFWIFPPEPESHFHKAFTAKTYPIYVNI
jgi:hypothetical protein